MRTLARGLALRCAVTARAARVHGTATVVVYRTLLHLTVFYRTGPAELGLLKKKVCVSMARFLPSTFPVIPVLLQEVSIFPIF